MIFLLLLLWNLINSPVIAAFLHASANEREVKTANNPLPSIIAKYLREQNHNFWYALAWKTKNCLLLTLISAALMLMTLHLLLAMKSAFIPHDPAHLQHSNGWMHSEDTWNCDMRKIWKIFCKFLEQANCIKTKFSKNSDLCAYL